jgi:hypothetical protein
MIVFIIACILVVSMLITKRNLIYCLPPHDIFPTKEEAPIMYWTTIIQAVIIGMLFLYDYFFGLW